MIEPTKLTRDEARAIGIAALTAACVSIATGLATWALETVKAKVQKPKEGDK